MDVASCANALIASLSALNTSAGSSAAATMQAAAAEVAQVLAEANNSQIQHAENYLLATHQQRIIIDKMALIGQFVDLSA